MVNPLSPLDANKFNAEYFDDIEYGTSRIIRFNTMVQDMKRLLLNELGCSRLLSGRVPVVRPPTGERGR